MVALSIGIAVFGACHAGLWGWRWYLAFRREAMVHEPLAQLQQRLSDVEKRVNAFALAPLAGRRIG